MANFSTYKNLELPTEPEHYNIGVFNKNTMVIDSEFHKLDIKNQSQDELLATKESLNSEIIRATNSENDIIEDLASETARAKSAENSNADNILNEITRAMAAEENISIALFTHNTSDSAHSDMRLLISELTTRLNVLADSDDTTLDQLSEIVAYIKNNKDLIDGITTSKVNVSDIIDNLTTTSTGKVLSAKQGQILKEMINSLTKEDIGLGNVENKNSATIRGELTKENVTNALGYTPPTTNTVYTHPTTAGNKHIPSGGSAGQILRWSADGTAVWGADNNTTYSNFVKSGSGAKSGLVPAPSTTAGATKYLREDGTWATPTSNGITYSDTQPTTVTTDMTWIGN